jgi:hypothetical protein
LKRRRHGEKESSGTRGFAGKHNKGGASKSAAGRKHESNAKGTQEKKGSVELSEPTDPFCRHAWLAWKADASARGWADLAAYKEWFLDKVDAHALAGEPESANVTQ